MDNVTLLDSYKETFDAFKKLFNFRLFFRNYSAVGHGGGSSLK